MEDPKEARGEGVEVTCGCNPVVNCSLLKQFETLRQMLWLDGPDTTLEFELPRPWPEWIVQNPAGIIFHS